MIVVGEATKKENKCFYAFHTDRNEQARKEGWLWENPPRQALGPHDGLPDEIRETKYALPHQRTWRIY